MYDQFYGLSYDPFRLTPTGRDVYQHPSFERARAYLEYGLLRGEGFVVVTGPPGSGKTTLVRALINDLPRNTRLAEIETSRLRAEDLLRLTVSRFDLQPAHRDKASMIEALRHNLLESSRGNTRSLLIVDEAQDLPADSLEELRLLTNLTDRDHPLLQILLLGQPGLRDMIQRPELEQFHQRMVASCRLNPLAEAETIEFIRFRLERAGWQGDPTITPQAMKLIHRASAGIPRRVNLLASRLMLHGFAEGQHALGVSDLMSVLEEMEDESVEEWAVAVNELVDEEYRDAASRPEPPAKNELREKERVPEKAQASCNTGPDREQLDVDTDGPRPEPVRPEDPADVDSSDPVFAEPSPEDAADDGQEDNFVGSAANPDTRTSVDASPGWRAADTDSRDRREPIPDIDDISVDDVTPYSQPTSAYRSRVAGNDRGTTWLPRAIAITMAVVALVIVIVAATPIGEGLEIDLHHLLHSQALTPDAGNAQPAQSSQ